MTTRHLINNRTKAFHSIFKISFVSDRCDIELQELKDQNAVNHATSELFLFGCYMGESFIHMLNQDFFLSFINSVDL